MSHRDAPSHREGAEGPSPQRAASVDVVAVCAGTSATSSARRLSDRVLGAVQARAAGQGLVVRARTVELHRLAVDLARAVVGAPVGPELRRALNAVERAGALVATSPVYKGAYSGLFKSFFDVLDPDVLAGTPVLLAASGGSLRHALVLEASMRPLFSFFGASTVPTGVFAADDEREFPDLPADPAGREARRAGGADHEPLGERIDRAARELVRLALLP